MTRVYSLDGRVFELDETMLAKSQMAADKVNKLIDKDSLPEPPPVGDFPQQGIPPHIQQMLAQGVELPIPEEARHLVRARSFMDGTIVIDIDVRAIPGASACGGPSCGPAPHDPAGQTRPGECDSGARPA